MSPHPLGLSNAQLQIVLSASARVPYRWRNRFLEGCADFLLGRDPLRDDDVRDAVQYVSRRMSFNVEGP